MRQAIEEYLGFIERNFHPDIRTDSREVILQRFRQNLLDFSHAVGDVAPLTLNREHYNWYAAALDMRGTEKRQKDAILDDVRRFLDWLQRRDTREIVNQHFGARRASIKGWLGLVFRSRR